MENQELDGQIFIKDDKGNTLEGEIIFEFEENGDDYVVYCIGDTMYVAKYQEDGTLSPIEDDEWPLVEKIVNSYFEDSEVEELE